MKIPQLVKNFLYLASATEDTVGDSSVHLAGAIVSSLHGQNTAIGAVDPPPNRSPVTRSSARGHILVRSLVAGLPQTMEADFLPAFGQRARAAGTESGPPFVLGSVLCLWVGAPLAVRRT